MLCCFGLGVALSVTAAIHIPVTHEMDSALLLVRHGYFRGWVIFASPP